MYFTPQADIAWAIIAPSLRSTLPSARLWRDAHDLTGGECLLPAVDVERDALIAG